MPLPTYTPCPWNLATVLDVAFELQRRDHDVTGGLLSGDAGVLLDLILEHHPEAAPPYLPLARTLFCPNAQHMRATHWLIGGWVDDVWVDNTPTAFVSARMLHHLRGELDFSDIRNGYKHVQTAGMPRYIHTLTDILCGWNHGQHHPDVIASWQVYHLIDRLTPSV